MNLQAASLDSPPHAMDVCVACSVFLFDWMCRPLPPTDYFKEHLRRKYFEKAIPELIPEIYRLLSKVNPLMKYMIDTKIHGAVQEGRWQRKGIFTTARRADLELQLLELEWVTTVQLFRKYVSEEDVDCLLSIIEDKRVLSYDTTPDLWLGMMLRSLMKDLPQIHSEHKKVLPDVAVENGLICPIEHVVASELFESAEDDLYA